MLQATVRTDRDALSLANLYVATPTCLGSIGHHLLWDYFSTNRKKDVLMIQPCLTTPIEMSHDTFSC